MNNEDIKFLKKLLNFEENEEMVALLLYKASPYLLRDEEKLSNYLLKKEILLEENKQDFTMEEYGIISKKLDYIGKTARKLPSMIGTSKPNKYYLEKYGEEIKELYLTNKDQEEVLNNIEKTMEDANYSPNTAKILCRYYGFSNIERVYEVLLHKHDEYELDIKLINLGIKPDTEGYGICNTKRYKMVYEYKILLNQLINSDSDEEIDSIVKKLTSTINNIYDNSSSSYKTRNKNTILNVAKKLYDDKTYQKLLEKLSKYFKKLDETLHQNINNDAKIRDRERRASIRKEKLEKAKKIVLDYAQNYQNINHETLINSLAVIKLYDKSSYEKYIKMIYNEDASKIINKFIESQSTSIRDFLRQEQISLESFNIYRELIDDDLKKKLDEKLKNDSQEAYVKIMVIINRMMYLVTVNKIDYAYILKTMQDNKVYPRALLNKISELKKDNDSKSLQTLEQMLIEIENDLKEKPQGSKKLMDAINSLKHYGNITFDEDTKKAVFKYLKEHRIPLTFLSYRSILISFTKNKSFDEDKIIK